MSAEFDNDLLFSDKNMRPLVLFFRRMSKVGQAIYVRGEGNFAKWVQRDSHVDIVADSFLELLKDVLGIEVKLRRPEYAKYTDILFETTSCTNPGKESEGWVYTCTADLLCYANLLPNRHIRVRILDMPKTQQWFKNLDLTPYGPPKRTSQFNHTESYAIPHRNIPLSLFLYKGIINQNGEEVQRVYQKTPEKGIVA